MVISERLREKLKKARSVCALTGAGVSAESGVPTFRGAQGLWAQYRPEDLACMEAFQRDPQLVWSWYQYRRNIIKKVNPNPGHVALVEMEKRLPVFTLITQNVDNLHRRAGQETVLELHGNIELNFCVDCKKDFGPSDEEAIPRCVGCGGYVRPGVVWFGESLPHAIFEQASRAASRCDVFFSVGTSALVYPAASLPMIARDQGAYVVEINPEETPLSSMMDEVLLGRSGEILPRITEFI
jgi:NAD-dependent deacetylase